jgi:hypothetical protein
VNALNSAVGGPVKEGTVGAGTGMVSYGFKGGIGTASRTLPESEGGYTVGVLVNANHGRKPELVVSGVPVGRLYDGSAAGPPPQPGQSEGSIIIVVATDAPLDGRQLNRLAKRAALGLARTGSTARHGSGDFIIAFSTANVIPHYPQKRTYALTHLADTHLNPVITVTVEATEEAVIVESPARDSRNQQQIETLVTFKRLHFEPSARYSHAASRSEDRMNEYQIGGGLRLLTAVEKTDAFGEFLKTRMVRALETEDPTELHYLLAQLDDYHSYMWRYYKKLAKDRSERMNPGV